VQIIKLIPTYYFADGVQNALQNQGLTTGVLFDLGLIAGCVLVFFVIATWLLRRQATVAASI
jgi:ABC-type multidrug transport system permease subunit